MPISVIIPCRNGARTVGAAVASALGQSVPPLEVLVVDDASEDATAEVAEGAGARVVRNAVRRNAGGARNAGLEVAQGDLIAFLDADAVAAPDWLERASGFLETHPDFAAVGGSIVNGRPDRYGSLDYYMNHSEWIGGEPGERTTFPTMSVVYRRSAIEGLRFLESNSGEDTAFALEVRGRGGRLWYDPAIRITHQHERLDWPSFRDHQVVCGRTIFWTRSLLDRPGKFLVRWPILLFTFPHLWLMLGRMIASGRAVDALRLFPWLVGGELARIRGFFAARREGFPAWLDPIVRTGAA
ncbi:MAG TPA: glycosyltransferase family 2 protein [Thermoanaerobaculia bacterium]|nr:glycosyltransferase family 2 protein [Thermoanaerobaculia bacterium]